jgi:glycogen operon protein
MLCGGDEYGRTQRGNNNAYCQDNEISWFTWERADWQHELLKFTSRLIHFRREHPIFRRPKFFQGRKIRGTGIKDVMWIDTDGTEMTDEDWTSSYVKCVGVMLSGDTMDVRDFHGELVRDDTFLLLFNAYHEPVKFVLAGQEDVTWQRILDTREEAGFLAEAASHSAGDELEVEARSMCVLRLSKGSHEHARTASWKKRKRGTPSAPPEPEDLTYTVDPTTAGAARNVPGAPPTPGAPSTKHLPRR